MKQLIGITMASLLIATSLFVSGCTKETEVYPEKESTEENKPSAEELEAAKKKRFVTIAGKKLQALYKNNPTSMQLQMPENGEEIAVIETTHGEIHIRFFPKETPETVKNFKELAKQEKYIDVPIHRVIKDFMIQMGDFENGVGNGGHSYKGPGTTIKDEVSDELEHLYGAVSMAKTALPHTAGSQFFIVQNANGTPHLDGVHTVFGQVIKGMNVVEEIANERTAKGDRPVNETSMKSVKIITYDAT